MPVVTSKYRIWNTHNIHRHAFVGTRTDYHKYSKVSINAWKWCSNHEFVWLTVTIQRIKEAKFDKSEHQNGHTFTHPKPLYRKRCCTVANRSGSKDDGGQLHTQTCGGGVGTTDHWTVSSWCIAPHYSPIDVLDYDVMCYMKTHLNIKSREITFVHNNRSSCVIIRKCYTKHSNDRVVLVLCEKSHTDG